MAAIDQLAGIANLVSSVQGKKSKSTTTSSGSQTTQTNVSDQGVQQLIQGILAGPGGVKSIGGAARSSGLYNSTTEQQMLGDLYARAANQAELARSPTTTTTTGKQTTEMQQDGMGLGTLAGVVGGGMLMNQLFKGGAGLFGSAGAAGGSAGQLASGLGNIGSNIGGALSGIFGNSSGAAIGGLSQNVGPEAVKMLAGAGGSTAAGGLSAASATPMASGLSGLGSFALPMGGALLGGLLGGKDAATDPLNLALSAGMGALALGPVGLVAAPIAAIAGGLLGDSSVICTALHKQGLVSKELFIKGHQHLGDLDVEVIHGYYIWAKPIARRIDAGSKFWKWAMYLPTLAYLNQTAGKKSLAGLIFHTAGHAACKLLFRASLAIKMMKLQED